MTMSREGHGVASLSLGFAEEDLTRKQLMPAEPDGFEIPVEIRLFRSSDCRNHAADELWTRVSSRGNDTVKWW